MTENPAIKAHGCSEASSTNNPASKRTSKRIRRLSAVMKLKRLSESSSSTTDAMKKLYKLRTLVRVIRVRELILGKHYPLRKKLLNKRTDRTFKGATTTTVRFSETSRSKSKLGTDTDSKEFTLPVKTNEEDLDNEKGGSVQLQTAEEVKGTAAAEEVKGITTVEGVDDNDNFMTELLNFMKDDMKDALELLQKYQSTDPPGNDMTADEVDLVKQYWGGGEINIYDELEYMVELIEINNLTLGNQKDNYLLFWSRLTPDQKEVMRFLGYEECFHYDDEAFDTETGPSYWTFLLRNIPNHQKSNEENLDN
jgi:hypothetical protein